MKKVFDAFTITLVGSMPRSKNLMTLKRKVSRGLADQADLEDLLEKETQKVVSLQEKNGINIITDGELDRDNYVSFISKKIKGIVTMNMGDMLEFIDDKKAFEQILEILDVPAVSIKNAICNGKMEYVKPLVADNMRKLKNYTNYPIKATLPGPYLMTRSMWLPALSQKHYANKEQLGKAVISILKKEIDHLLETGVDVIQFDEPVLTEVVFSEGKTRSFMCAALAEKKDPAEELEFATHLIKSVFDYLRDKPVYSSLHVCRGNWSKDEQILLSGPYTPLVGLFENVLPDVLTLEFSTHRAGEVESLLSSKKIKDHCILGFGVINPRIDEIEQAEDIVNQVEKALKYIAKGKIWLNPDCGFATFANRPVSTFTIIEKKLEQLKLAKNILKDKYE
ncbi:cobalamin-independent methionine synthase II family protein [Facklamia sp. P12937]|uniref:cobalamin-independent methionine synthase II family protein n=1 Tax=Facklamia sp. P12937 TaxID=3421949 RepID=UPI003D16CAB2